MLNPKVKPWPDGAPFLSEIAGDPMTDNTITPEANTLTPSLLREALDQWCEDQPGVMYFSTGTLAWQVKYCPLSKFEKDAEIARVYWTGNTLSISDNAIDRLTLVAIEHRYRPWLELAASLPYTGAKAARLALQALGEEKPLSAVIPVFL